MRDLTKLESSLVRIIKNQQKEIGMLKACLNLKNKGVQGQMIISKKRKYVEPISS